jgi:hypothetical protein
MQLYINHGLVITIIPIGQKLNVFKWNLISYNITRTHTTKTLHVNFWNIIILWYLLKKNHTCMYDDMYMICAWFFLYIMKISLFYYSLKLTYHFLRIVNINTIHFIKYYKIDSNTLLQICTYIQQIFATSKHVVLKLKKLTVIYRENICKKYCVLLLTRL